MILLDLNCTQCHAVKCFYPLCYEVGRQTMSVGMDKDGSLVTVSQGVLNHRSTGLVMTTSLELILVNTEERGALSESQS